MGSDPWKSYDEIFAGRQIQRNLVDGEITRFLFNKYQIPVKQRDEVFIIYKNRTTFL